MKNSLCPVFMEKMQSQPGNLSSSAAAFLILTVDPVLNPFLKLLLEHYLD